MFSFYSNSDLHNADQVIAYIDQGGLSLPDRDYYIKDDADKVEMRKHLAEYVTQLFTLAGQTPQQAAEFGADCADGWKPCWRRTRWTAPRWRDPKNRDHKMTREEAVALAPEFYLNRYFRGGGRAEFHAS